MNVALVVMDTLRADSFREHFDWLSGIRFTNTWATSHWTVHVDNQSLDCPEPVIAEQFTELG